MILLKVNYFRAIVTVRNVKNVNFPKFLIPINIQANTGINLSVERKKEVLWTKSPKKQCVGVYF